MTGDPRGQPSPRQRAGGSSLLSTPEIPLRPALSCWGQPLCHLGLLALGAPAGPSLREDRQEVTRQEERSGCPLHLLPAATPRFGQGCGLGDILLQYWGVGGADSLGSHTAQVRSAWNRETHPLCSKDPAKA